MWGATDWQIQHEGGPCLQEVLQGTPQLLVKLWEANALPVSSPTGVEAS
jgi:hypothetical protein